MLRKTRVRVFRAVLLPFVLPAVFMTAVSMTGVFMTGWGGAEIRCHAQEGEAIAGIGPGERERVEEMLRDSPGDPALLFQLAGCQLRDAQYKEAADTLEKVIEKTPHYVQCYQLLADVCVRRLRDKIRAEACMKKLVEANPDDAEAWSVRGEFYLGLGADPLNGRGELRRLHQKALGDAERALELGNSDPEILKSGLPVAALAASQLGRHDAAYQYAGRLIESHPDFDRAYWVLSLLELRRGNEEDSVEWLRRGLAPTSDSPVLLSALTDHLVRKRHFEEATELLEGAIKKAPADYRLCQLLAKIYVVDLKDAKRGDACMARMIESNPADGDAFRERARYYFLRGADPRMKDADRVKLTEKALKDAQKAVELSPNDAECVRTALEAAGQLRNDETMLRYGRRLTELLPRDDAGYLALVDVETRRGDLDGAVAWLRKGLAHNETSAVLLWILTDRYIQQEKLEEARETLDRLRRLGDAADDPAYKTYVRVRVKHAEAAIEATNENWNTAKAMFEANRFALKDSPDVLKSCDSWIARCHDALGRSDRALEAMKRSASGTVQDGEYAKKLTARVSPEKPRNVEALRTQIELEKQRGDLAAMEARIDQLREIEGEGPHWHYFSALLLEARYLKNVAEAESGSETSNRDLLERAIAHLSQADALKPEWVEVMLVTANAYHNMGNLARAIEYYDRAVKLGERRPEVLLRQAELLVAEKRIAEADRRIEAVLAANPDDPMTLTRVPELYRRMNRRAEAVRFLQRIVDGEAGPKADIVFARRQLVGLFKDSGSYKNYLTALELIDANLKRDPDSRDDLRSKAWVLASRSNPERRDEMIGLLEGLAADPPENPSHIERTQMEEDRYLLAQFYLRDGKPAKADELMHQLLAARDGKSLHFDVYVRELINRRRGAEAGIWVDRIEEIAPAAFATAELRAAVLAAQGKTEEAIGVLNAFLASESSQPSKEAQRLLLVARTFATIGRLPEVLGNKEAADRFNAEAEDAYRRLIAKYPGEGLRLATFLAGIGRVDEAIEILERTWRRAKTPTLGAAAVSMTVGSGATEEQIGRIEKVLDEAIAGRKSPVALTLAKAEIAAYQGRNEEAEKLYRDAVERNPRNIVALNNLAVFLAKRGTKLEEAERLMDRCIDILGPVPPLRDSRAGIQLALENWDAAIFDLDEAIAVKPTPTRYFQLARAHFGNEDRDAAKTAMAEAFRHGLGRKHLYKAEIGAYERLLKELDIQQPGGN